MSQKKENKSSSQFGQPQQQQQQKDKSQNKGTSGKAPEQAAPANKFKDLGF